MPHFPSAGLVNSIVISTASPESIGRELSATGIAVASASGVGSRAYFVPVTIYRPLIIVKMFIENGATVAGNVDLGIYDFGGKRIVSSGSLLQSGTSVIQEFNIADTTLNPGYYYMAMSLASGSATTTRWANSTAYNRMLGCGEQTGSFPLPATAVLSPLSSATIPAIYMTQSTTI